MLPRLAVSSALFALLVVAMATLSGMIYGVIV